MKKGYRIVMYVGSHNSIYFQVQKRWMFFWNDIGSLHSSLSGAKAFVNRILSFEIEYLETANRAKNGND